MCRTIVLALCLALPSPLLLAGEPEARPSVAVLDFDARELVGLDYGAKISDLTTIVLSSSDDLVVVERKKLKDVLKEQELSLSGMVDADQSIDVGKLTGAKLIVCGRAFPIDDHVIYTAKVISTETSRLVGVMLKTKPDVSVSEAALELAAKVAEKIAARQKDLLPHWKPADPARELAALTEKKKLPTLAFVIPEEHIDRRVIDPAAETELMTIAKQAGFDIIDVDKNGLSKWAAEVRESKRLPVPAALSKVDVVIVGEAFSETGATFDQLRTCRARLEAMAIDARTGEVLAVHRAEASGVDLGDAIAGKKALAAAAREIAVALLAATIPE